jgi:mono/diheme cytochrome c family protein
VSFTSEKNNVILGSSSDGRNWLRIFRPLIACLIGSIAMLAACSSEAPPAPHAATPPDRAAAKRGAYLFAAAGCVGCHTDTAHGGARLAGGKGIETPFGAYYSRNITPDPVHGIGAWSDADFLRALREGIAPGGAHYFPAFPYPAFTLMTDGDILDIWAYLRTQPPQPTENRPHDVSFPFDVRLTMLPWRALYFNAGPFKPDPAQSAQWNRGAYLANAVAHCGECHTPRTLLGGREDERRFNGGTLVGTGAKHAPNITPDPTDGIGKWRLEDILTLLKTGMMPNGDFVQAPMSDVVEDTAKLTETDRVAIATYLKSLPPLPGKGG